MTDDGTERALDAVVEKLFTGTGTHEAVSRAESDGLDPSLWKTVEELGLAWIGVDEASGGSGGSLTDLLAVLRAAGRHAMPLPLAETNLAAWVLASCGQPVSAGPATVVPGTPRDTLEIQNGRLRGTGYGIPWASQASRIVGVLPDGAGHRAVVIDPALVTIRRGADLAGMPADTISADDVEVDTVPWARPGDAARVRGGLLWAALMAGALEAVRDLTIAYTRERSQFGRPVAANQAVQHHLVTLAQAAATSDSAVQQAALATTGDGDASFAAGAAKLVVNHEAGVAVRAAHQAHGAIGLTAEYRLQQLTRRLNSWRLQFGTEGELSGRIGLGVAARGSLTAFISGDEPV